MPLMKVLNEGPWIEEKSKRIQIISEIHNNILKLTHIMFAAGVKLGLLVSRDNVFWCRPIIA